MKNNENVTPISDILDTSGKYQYFQYFLICLPAMSVMMSNANYVYVAGDINYRCKIQECESSDQPFIPNWWPGEVDRCSRPVLNISEYDSNHMCTNKSFTQQLETCTEWIYETNDTIVAEFNLACQLWKQNFVGTAHGIGTIAAMLVSGWIVDRFGRKFTFVICAMGGFLGNLKLFATSYSMFVVFEFLEAAFSEGVLSVGAVLMIEISAKKNRMLSGVIYAYAIYSGEVIFACLGMVIKYWKTLVLIIYSPSILFFSFLLLIKESPRWQILQGKMTDAKKVLYVIAKMNNINIDTEELKNIDDKKLKKMFNLDKEEKREGYKEVFKSFEMVKRFSLGFASRFTVSFIYYCLVVKSVYLPGDKYTNFLLTAIASYPGEILSLVLMRRFGRKLPLMYGFVICGITSVTSECLPDHYVWIKIIIFLICKMAIATCFTGTVTYTMELFPTSVRGSMLSLCTLASCLGNMVAPLIPALTAVSPLLPPVCFGCSTLVTSLLLCTTPETSNLPLPDTIKQIDNNLVFKNKNEPARNVKPEDNLGFESHF